MNFIINRKITICMLFIAFTLLGYVSYKQLPVELLPNAELPVLYVNVYGKQDVDPAYITSEVAIPIEGAIKTIEGVGDLTSNVSSRGVSVRVDFKKSADFKMASLKLEEKLNEKVSSLPEGFTVNVRKVDVNRVSNSMFTLQILGSGGVDRIRNIVDEEIKTDLENIDGIASVNVYGGREKAIEVQLNIDACKALNLSPSKIASKLTDNTQEKAFVGFATEKDNQYFINVNSVYGHVTELENIVVAPGPILLKDVATLFFDLKEETSFSRVDGKDAISVTLVNDSQANAIELSHRVIEAVRLINEEFAPLDIEISIEENLAEVMENNINQIIDLALVGGLLAIGILWFFLKNLRLVLFIALSIPISIYTAFNLFFAFGVTINSLTLIGMALAIGMLLDNSIVVLENIYRLSALGYSPEKAAIQGTKEVWRSIVAATLTTITVFLPFVFSDNFLIKMIGHNIGVSIISTLTISLFVALLFIPMVTYLMLKSNKGASVFYEKVSIYQRPVQLYIVVLKTCMRNPGKTIFSAVLLFVASLALAMSMNIKKMKEVESDRLNIRVEMAGGSTLEKSDLIVKMIETRLDSFPEKKSLISRILEEDASLTLVLKEDYEKISNRGISEIKEGVKELLKDITGAEIQVNEAMGGSNDGGVGNAMSRFMRMMGVGSNQEHIIVKGSDYDMMQLVAQDVKYYIEELEFISNVWMSRERTQPEVRLDFDSRLLTSYDITRSDLSTGLTDISDEYTSNTKLKIGNDNYSIVIRSDVSDEVEKNREKKKKRGKTIDELKQAQISSKSKGSVHTLNDIATTHKTRGTSQIRRVNQEQQISLYYNFNSNVRESNSLLETYRGEIEELVLNYNVPGGVAIELVQEESELDDFKFLIVAAFILIFMILASVFESVITPLVLLFSIPLAGIGSLLALILTNNSLQNSNTLIGFLILLGVVVNNGIILIDYSNILRVEGYRRNRALIMSGLSRMRPIMITSITTIVAMLPLAMGDSEYAGAIGSPFAITVIGGLAFSALLTLIFIPTVAMGMENSLAWYRALSRKVHVIHIIIFIIGCFGIYQYVGGVVMQSVYLLIFVALIPIVTQFAQTSLRKAQSQVVDVEQEVSISIRNLVKIYDWSNRLKRQVDGGVNIRRRLGLDNQYHTLRDFVSSIWQFVLYGFMIYFTYIFLESKLWIFILSFAIYASTLYLWRKIRKYLYFKFPSSKVVKYLNRILFWALPMLVLFGLYMRMDNVGLVFIVAFIGIVVMTIYLTSNYLYRNNVNIERIKGRMSNTKRNYYRIVKSIPVIGKKTTPFKALRGVSFDIKTGMFGLLGPNGAGKSTLMRIICGILEQSYGTIWINGLDTREHREELQGLIGFLPQEFGTYENMSSWEFLDYQAILKGLTDSVVRKERLEYVLKAVHMYDRKDAKIGSFSGGMKQRIGIALILLHLPRILVVDEPTAGLDPRERIRFRNLLVELSKNRIVIFSTHIIEDISSSCNQVAVINRGELKYFGDPIDMIEMAKDKIWVFTLPREDFEEKLDATKVIHHIQQDGSIQVRYLSVEKPWDSAVVAEANLEDAYLCLLKNMN